uniref:ABC transporter domain-containing protein n=1 Tax=Ciona savignyi TaxID=51511 RepID=H2YX22_CIOSA
MFWQQLRLLLWKNFILRKRHPIRTIIEVLWPIFLFAILVAIRKTQPIDTKGECHYPGRAMPSAGIYPWFKSMFCDLENPCFSKEVPSEVPGQINSPGNANSAWMGNAVSSILMLLQQNTSITQNQNQIIKDLQAVQNFTAQLPFNSTRVGFSTVIQNSTAYTEFVTNNLSIPYDVVKALLNSTVSPAQLLNGYQDIAVSCKASVVQLPIYYQHNSFQQDFLGEISLSMYVVLHFLNTYTVHLPFTCTTLITIKIYLNGVNMHGTSLCVPMIYCLLFFPSDNAVMMMTMQCMDFVIPRQYKTVLNLLEKHRNSLGVGKNIVGNILSIHHNNKCVKVVVLKIDLYIVDGFNSTVFCQNLTAILESNNQFKLLWDVLKPLLLGKIPYSPDTPLVRSIIKRANATFETIAIVKEFGQMWQSTNGPALHNFLENGSTVHILDTIPLSTLSTLLNISVSNLEQVRTFLSNDYNATDGVITWKDLYYQLNSGILFITNVLGCFELNKFEGYQSEQRLVDASLSRTKNKTLWGAIVFMNPTENSEVLPKIVKYKIRQDAGSVTKTTSIQSFSWEPDAEADYTSNKMAYYNGGFLFLQDMVEQAIIEGVVPEPFVGRYMQEFPYPCYTYDEFLEYLSALLSLLMTLAWIYSVCIIIKNIVYEKEQRLKEVMKMMGLSNGVHWVAWFINSFSLMFLSILLLILVLKVGDVTPYSNMFIVLIWLCCFAIATISQCFLISCFFSRANLAAACGGIIYFLMYIPYNMTYAWQDEMTISTKLVACLLSTVAFGYGAGYISQYEMSGDGIQFSNWNTSPDPSDHMNFLLSMLMMLVDAAIYLILTWYIEAVFPGQYGVPRPWNFFLQRSYWCGSTDDLRSNESYSAYNQDDPSIKLETEPSHLKLGVSMHNLSKKKIHKIFSSNGKVAVDGLSLNFYENQITAFLGHNGAGKTTTMSMLTGLFPPSGGTASIYKKDIQTDMDSIRHELGFCPQHNVLFGDLTVLEHLQLYAGLKGSSSGKTQSESETNNMLQDVGLPHKKHEMTRHLSGGMKRKLSVAIAFVGGSKCVVLDEPTAGVDPYARRGIWDLLLHYKQNRTIVLSTHHMDEADLLGDRIAIISHGKLKCCGSSLFLKSCFGVGYYLTLVTDDKEISPGESPLTEKAVLPVSSQINMISYKKSSILAQMVTDTISGVKLYEDNGREITFVLPYSAQTDGSYAKLFEKLNNANANYGLTDTSLEEIFLNVAEHSKDDGKEENTKCSHPAVSTSEMIDHSISDDVSMDDTSQGIGSYKVEGNKLIRQQFLSLFVKRFHHARRNTKGIVAQVIVPAAFVALALTFALIIPQTKEYPSLELQPWMYGDTNTFFSNDNSSSNITSSASNALINDPSIGMRCVKDYSVYNYDKKFLTCNADWKIDSTKRALSQNVTSNETIECSCTDKQTRVLLAECPVGTGGAPTPRIITRTSNPMYNMTQRNLSDWLVKTVGETLTYFINIIHRFKQSRFGGLSFGAQYYNTIGSMLTPLLQFSQSNSNFTLNINPNSSNNIQSVVQRLVRTDNSKVWFDNSGWHSMPTWLNIMNNAALRSSLPPSADPTEYGIAAFNHPLNFTETEVDLAAFTQSATDTIISISVIFALAFVPASFVLFLIEEKVSKAKHLQFVSGVNQFIYWIANFTWDMLNYSIPAIIVIIIFLCFQTDAYVSAANLPCLVCLLFLYGFAITPMMYPASFYFEVPSTAYVVLTCINLFIGINTSIATFILEVILLDDPNLTEVNNALKIIFLAFPQYCLGRALIDMAINQAYADAYASFGKLNNPFDYDLVGRNLLAMAIEGVVFFILTVLIQYRFFIKHNKIEDLSKIPRRTGMEDDDVTAEKKRLLEEGDITDILQIKNLTKVYKKLGSKKRLLAVDRMSIGVPRGECFGLLGVNGAGKTTTFKMLTGDIAPTAGDATICHQSILDNIREVQQNTGYCPQFEALNQLLTGREHLEFYAKLRGVPPEDIDRVAQWGIMKFGLKMYADKSAGTYSGGNKRKLSAAIAFIGCPPVVFLDEPTAGMDPLSRRFLWSRISEVVSNGRCIVLTSHSMEECEALCSRLAIMVNGSFKCIGSPQHLKNRYGEGYTITVKVSDGTENLENVQAFIQEAFPNCVVKESHSSMIMVPLEDMNLSFLFDEMERNKSRLSIEDYSVNQTTLDEVFVSFAKLQTD